jgi:hypothetical protein
MTMPHTLPWSLAVVTALSLMVSGSSLSAGQSQDRSVGLPAGGRALNPDPPCFDSSNRYVDCGNGTITDTATGLIWLKDAGCLGQSNWVDANRMAARLRHGRCGLSDQSKAGDWRLPSNAEWMAMVAVAKNHPLLLCTNPALTDDSGAVCFNSGNTSSFTNVASGGFWSSTTSSQSSGLLPDGSKAGTMNLLDGFLASFFDKSCCPQRVWPVRGQ